MPINYQLQWEKRYVLVIGLANIGATEGKLKLGWFVALLVNDGSLTVALVALPLMNS